MRGSIGRSLWCLASCVTKRRDAWQVDTCLASSCRFVSHCGAKGRDSWAGACNSASRFSLSETQKVFLNIRNFSICTGTTGMQSESRAGSHRCHNPSKKRQPTNAAVQLFGAYIPISLRFHALSSNPLPIALPLYSSILQVLNL